MTIESFTSLFRLGVVQCRWAVVLIVPSQRPNCRLPSAKAVLHVSSRDSARYTDSVSRAASEAKLRAISRWARLSVSCLQPVRRS